MTNEPASIDDDKPNTADSADPTGSDAQSRAGADPRDPSIDAPETAKDVEDLDLTPEGLSDAPAHQDDQDTLVRPHNSDA